jgi:mycothiol synthase
MGLAPGYSFRAPTEDELDAVAEILIADQRAEGVDPPVLDASFLRRIWRQPDFDLARDAWLVANAEGALVAYGQVRRDEPDVIGSWGVVHPAQRGRGIGAALFDRLEGRAAELLAGAATPHFRHSINAGDKAAAALIGARGLRPIRHHWHMQIDLTGPIDPGPAPDGIDITAVEPPDDLPAVHAVLDRAFAEDALDHPEPYDQWLEADASGPSFDPTLWLLARDGLEAVGALAASAGDDGGWVDWLAVLPSHRGRGIGAALLRQSFARFTDRAVRRVVLNVDAENVTGATRVYEAVGMRVVNRWDLWERPTKEVTAC